MNQLATPQSLKTLRDYFLLANVTLSDKGEHLNRAHCLIGLKTESGEALDALKRHVFYSLPLNVVNLVEEIGDLAWYCHIPVLETLNKDLENISPFKYTSLIESLDLPLEEYVKRSVIDFVFDGEVDFDATEDFDSDISVAPEMQQLRDMLEDSKLNLPEVFNDLLLACLETEDMSLLDTCCYVMRKLAVLSFALDIPLQNVLQGNIGKLLKRYPKEKFDNLDTSLRDLLGEENKVETAISTFIPNAVKGLGSNYSVTFPYINL